MTKNPVGQNLDKRFTPAEAIRQIKELVEEGLWMDGGHHKQWYLEQIADILGIAHENEGICP